MKAFSKFTNIGALRIKATAPVPIAIVPIAIGIIGTIAHEPDPVCLPCDLGKGITPKTY